MYTIKDKIYIFDDDQAFIYKGVVSKFVVFGQLYYLFSGDKNINIPCSPTTNHHFIMDDDSLTIDSCTIKLLENIESESYLAIHYKAGMAPPLPNVALRIPDFVCNFIRLETVDNNERSKEFLHIVDEPLQIGKNVLKFTKLSSKKLFFDVTVI